MALTPETASGEASRDARAGEVARYQLVVFGGSELVTHDLPVSGEVTIGRAEGNVVRIDHGSVSRHHAVLRLGDVLVVEDLGGQNGTFVRIKNAEPGSKTESVLHLVRKKAEVSVGDGIVLGTVSAVLRRAPRRLLPSLPGPGAARKIRLVARSPAMKQVYEDAERAARARISLLILGETGVGKEVLARAIHERSPRARGPYLGINCAALTESLLETELFGCEKGAFTGAVEARAGLFEAASGGTVFLDEVGELSLTTQAKLLRVLEERTVLRVGGTKPRDIDVRFVAATNRDLAAAVERNEFRSDLFFRLNVLTLTVPPLRERREEISSLVKTFLEANDRDHDRVEPLGLSRDALDVLLRYTWPGNVRELRNVIERAAVLSTGPSIEVEHLPPKLVHAATAGPRPEPALDPAGEGDPAPEPKRDERARIEEALRRCGGNQTRAAAELGISRRTLVNRLDTLGLRRPRKGPATG